jgi:hypothetical protein
MTEQQTTTNKSAELATVAPQPAATVQSDTLRDVMDYARAVQSAQMLPDNYRGKPADIMLAVGLGSSMGLSPAESLYRIAVIKGKPTASAELIAANVRKRGPQAPRPQRRRHRDRHHHPQRRPRLRAHRGPRHGLGCADGAGQERELPQAAGDDAAVAGDHRRGPPGCP